MKDCCETSLPKNLPSADSLPENRNCCGDPKFAAEPCCAPGVSAAELSSRNPAARSAGPDNADGHPAPELPGFSVYPFVEGWLQTPVGRIPQVRTKLTLADKRGHWAVRWGIVRNSFQITPGLYAVGWPTADSQVFVSANYKFSFDCLRSALSAENAWLLVIDTKGVNVWCAAGKGTFGTAEIVNRVERTRLDKLVNHRKLIVPQLGAPGIAAYKVKQDSGFSVIYGPVKATDIKTFLANGFTATEEMRQVSFSFWERLVLTPVELVLLAKKIFFLSLALFVLSGIGADIFSLSAAWQRGLAATLAGLTGVVTGCVFTPLLLPWIPARSFAAKGALLGIIAATTLALGPYQSASFSALLALYLFILAVASYTAMNFTGSSTYTSPSGVEKEMRIALPCQALAALLAGLLWISAAF